jgi:hypothetical protein
VAATVWANNTGTTVAEQMAATAMEGMMARLHMAGQTPNALNALEQNEQGHEEDQFVMY